MEEYADKTEVGTVVTVVNINIVNHEGRLTIHSRSNGIHKKEYKVACQNESYLIIDDPFLTKESRRLKGEKREAHNSYLETPWVDVVVKDTFFSTGIFGEIKTVGSVDKAIKKLSKAMKDKIRNEYGFLSNIDVDSFVKEHVDVS